MIIVSGDQRTEEWSKARCGLATASNFAAVMAQGRTKGTEATTRKNYRIRLAIERLTGVPQSDDLSFSRDVQNGIEREPQMRMLYEIATESMVEEVSFIRHDTLMCGVSPDGWMPPKVGLEGKCPGQAAHLSYLRLVNEPPSEYKWQVHGLIWLADLERCDFTSFNPDFPEELRLHIVPVHRDESLIAELRNGVEQFLAEVDATVAEIRDMADARRPMLEAA